MDTLVSLIQNGFSSIAPFFILLGLLIFVHELGHFAVAKFFKVKVEVFSLGFGKKIFQFKKGDTTYCISLIPLGGYVKMFGDDPTMEVSEEEKKVAFLHKPVMQRIAIVLAGPLMNLFFAVLLYFMIGLIGIQVPGTQIGDIKSESIAYQSGFRSGDKILSVIKDNIPLNVQYWEQVEDVIQNSADQNLTFKVERENKTHTVESTPKLAENDFIFTTQRQVGKIEGLEITSKAPVVGYSDQNSLAAKFGFYNLSIIEEINGKNIEYFRNIETIFANEMATKEKVEIKIKEFIYELDKAQSKTITFTKTDSNTTNFFNTFGFESTELFLIKVTDDSPAQKAGLLYGDKILEINNQKISEWKQIVESIKSYKGDGSPISIKVMRSGQEADLNVIPKMTELSTAQGQEDKRFTIGIIPALSQSPPPLIKKVYTNPLASLGFGVEKSWDATKLIAIGIVRLIQGEVSSKNVGGVISIGVVASKSFKVGITTFLNTMALISINLFLLNLLPVPVLDGGHLVFFGIEALRGAPLSMRKMEIAQQIGLALLLGLMVFALFNDVSNLLNSPW